MEKNYQNVTIQVEEQARQTIIKSEAEANAVQIKANALAQNHKLVEYETVMYWDGKLPEYMIGNAMPFIKHQIIHHFLSFFKKETVLHVRSFSYICGYINTIIQKNEKNYNFNYWVFLSKR